MSAVPAPRPRGVNTLRFPRSADDRWLAGVAGGLAPQLGVDAAVVRAAFVVLGLAGGVGAVAYLLALAVSRPPGAPAAAPREPTLRQGLAIGCLVAAVLLVLRDAGLWLGDPLVIPGALAAVGWAVINMRGKPGARWQRTPSQPTGTTAGRMVAGGVLVLIGMGSFLAAHSSLAAVGTILLAVAITTAGLGLMFGSWISRLVGELTEERRERIRSEERAEMAAHLHDSVLQTLALIQRNAGSPRRMAHLARSQERELRAWLYGGRAHTDGDHLKAALDAAAEAVERDHEVAVELVVVGDAPLGERSRALVHACREAITNAARHSKADEVSVYVEVEPDAVNAFVRDRGIGFDPSAVPDDRRGIADSIRGRLERHGGTIAITTSPGEGTEVHMRIPRGTA